MMVHTFNPSTQKAEAGESLWVLRPAWSTQTGGLHKKKNLSEGWGAGGREKSEVQDHLGLNSVLMASLGFIGDPAAKKEGKKKKLSLDKTNTHLGTFIQTY